MTRTSNRSSTTVRESVAALLLATKERYQGRRSKDVDRSERWTGIVNDAIDEQVATAEG